jgi:hypothetical protein
MLRKTLSVIAWLLAPAALPASAQTTTGGITGVVRDAGGGVLPGVTVTVTREATGAVTTAVTNGAGVYVLRGLPVGRYLVVAALAGFQGAKDTDVVVRVNEDVRLDVALSVGAVTDTVTVGGKVSTADTTTGTLKIIVDQEGGTRVQVRIEAFNAFNWVDLGTPNTSQNSANFGRITRAGSPRVMQGALRFSF